ncbi:MAG: hypothetical protein ACOC16_01445 [Nanoarchaeota archaeon]
MKFLFNLLWIVILIFSFLFVGCNIPTIKDLELNKDHNLYAGNGEICENSYIKVNCQEGLECKTVTTKPHIIKVCYPYNEELPEDFVYKNTYENDVFIEQKNNFKRNSS